MSLAEITQKIERNLSTINHEGATVEVGFFGGSFTCLHVDKQKQYLEIVQPYIHNRQIDSIRLSTRPDYIDEAELLFLQEFHVKTIELGVQSMDDDVLKASGRGHTALDVVNASKLIKSHGFQLGLQMMVGLPGDDADTCIHTAQMILSLQPDFVRIYPTLVIQNTELEDLYRQGKYKAMTLEEGVDRVAPILRLFLSNSINVIRVGLHPSEEFEKGGKLLAGPYHPSFRELVMTKLWFDELRKIPVSKHKDISITVPTSDYNVAIGFNASNRNYLKQQFRRVRFLKSDSLNNFSYHVDYC